MATNHPSAVQVLSVRERVDALTTRTRQVNALIATLWFLHDAARNDDDSLSESVVATLFELTNDLSSEVCDLADTVATPTLQVANG